MMPVLLAMVTCAGPVTTGTYALEATAEAIAAGRFDPHWPARPGNRRENVAFRADGTVDIQCFMDRERLEYRWVARQSAEVLGELARNPGDPKTTRWAKLQPVGVLETRQGEAPWRERLWQDQGGVFKTDLFQACGYREPELVMWTPRPLDAVAEAAEDRLTRAALAGLPAELRAGPGRMTITGADATIDGQKLRARVFPCAASCEDGARERRCVELRPEPRTPGPLFLLDGKSLVELVDAVACDLAHPSGYELMKGGRRFTGTAAPSKGSR